MWILLGLAVASLLIVGAYVYLKYDPNRNLDADSLWRGIMSLLRLWEDTASLTVIPKRSSQPLFLIVKMNSQNNSCRLICSVIDRSLGSHDKQKLEAAFGEHGYELAFQNGVAREREDTVVTVALEVPNVWSQDAANGSARLMQMALQMLGADPKMRFKLEWRGRRSLDGLQEWRRRLRNGEDVDWRERRERHVGR